MAATCVVSGTILNSSGVAVENASIKAYITTPFFVSNEYITPVTVSTTSDSSGNWSLTLVRTATLSPTRTVTLVIEYPDGVADKKRTEYTITVPNSATASFSNLVTIA